VAALEIEYTQAMGADTPKSQALKEELAAQRADLEEMRRRLSSLEVTAKVEGTLVMPRPQDLPGSYIGKGTVLAHVLRPEDISVKVVVPQADAGLIRSGTEDVEVALSDRRGELVSAKLTGEVPAATAILPTAALGDRAGGPVATDPTDKDGTRTLEPVFLFDVRLASKQVERWAAACGYASITAPGRWGAVAQTAASAAAQAVQPGQLIGHARHETGRAHRTWTADGRLPSVTPPGRGAARRAPVCARRPRWSVTGSAASSRWSSATASASRR
jgi:hypothetical protein